MVRFVRAATIAPGKVQPAMAFAADIAAHVKSVNGTNLKVFVQVGGVMGRICWQSDIEDLGAYQQMFQQVLGDADYLKKVAESGEKGLFIAGKTRGSLWMQT